MDASFSGSPISCSSLEAVCEELLKRYSWAPNHEKRSRRATKISPRQYARATSHECESMSYVYDPKDEV
ncbi:hypothetical protein PM082_004711 [Marasmius tenuissimus]|nr:hypothetical protein PM082_004711 [Marasmius tenuissimus]